jgi:hypothetical protein
MSARQRQRVNFEQLIRKVSQAEDVLEARERRVVASYRHLRQTWREGWTPVRIIAAGLISGFVAGRAEPLRALTGPRLLQMVSAVSGLFASAQAAFAARQAEDAAESAEAKVEEAAAPGRVAEAQRNAAATQPRAAEAATELSEH